MVAILTLLYLFLAIVYLFGFSRGRMFLNPASLWVFGQIVFYSGTYFIVDASRTDDMVNLVIMFSGLVSFIFGAAVLRTMYPITQEEAKAWFKQKVTVTDDSINMKIIWGFIILSVLIGYLYYQAIGYNVFIESFRSYFIYDQGLLRNVATLRLDTYSTGRYLAPGYVNQFKNILLPLLTIFVIAERTLLKKSKLGTVLTTVILLPITVVLLLGTGQRGAFFIVSLMAASFIYVSLPRQVAKKWLFVAGVTFLVLFSMATLFLGRTEYGGSFASIPLQLIQQIAKRFFSDNQSVNVYGFRFVYSSSIQFGQGWLDGLADILPGRTVRSTPMLASIVFSILTGSSRGTAPVSIWSETWYNWGLVGIPIVGFILGWSYQFVYHRLIRGSKELFRLTVYSAVYVLLGLWAVSGPVYLINGGLITVLLLYALVSILKKTQKRSSHTVMNNKGMSYVRR